MSESGPGAPAPSPPSREFLALLGRVVYLLGHSPLHRSYEIAELERLFLPPIRLDQYRYYQRGDQPLAFVSWGWFTPEVSAKYITGEYEPEPEDWNAGPDLWFTEFITPFGDLKAVMRDLTHHILPDARGRGLRRDNEGNLRKVTRFHGVNVYRSKENQA